MRYIDRYRREAGRWLFAKRVVTFDFRDIKPVTVPAGPAVPAEDRELPHAVQPADGAAEPECARERPGDEVYTMKYVDDMRMNHVEVTIPVGSLQRNPRLLVPSTATCSGFRSEHIESFRPEPLFLTRDIEGSQFMYVAEHDHPMIVGGDDHVGFHVRRPATVDAI